MEDAADMDTGENGTANFSCNSVIDMEHYLHYSLVPSAIIILVLSYLERRLRRWGFSGKLSSLYGCCGVVIPFDFVSMFSNRWPFGFAFGATADKLMFLFTQDFPQPTMPNWARVFWIMLIAIEVGFSSYPFFACLSTNYQRTGAILGCLYSLSWLIVMLIDVGQCPHGDNSFLQEYENLILFWPSLLCQFFLLARFLQIIVKSFKICSGQAILSEETSFLECHQVQHVQQLMKKPPPQPPEKSWIQRKLYEWDPYFRFPSRMISTSVVVLICLYMFIMYEIIAYKYLSRLTELVLLEGLAAAFNISEDPNSWFSELQEFVKVSQGAWIATTVTSTLTCITYVFHILACYRKHIKRLRVGKKQFLMSDITRVSHSLSVVALARYSSWQIAYTVWGYFLMHLVQWVAVMILMYVVVLPMIHGQWAELIAEWGTVILTFVLVMLIKRLQLLMAARFFLQPRISPGDQQKPLALDNRKTFQNFTYFLFFYTVVVGLVSCLMRLLRSVALGVWLIGRIDRPVMPKGYEACDMGFKTWVGMLLMDHYHTNPSLLYFCHILIMKKRAKELQRATYVPGNELRGTAFRVSARARTRWLLLYTLLNNPSLTKLRKPKSWPQSVHFPAKFSV
ncbi:PREDICTED: stimulated by retinoic acid gene 6 protein homolog isoform X2 [Gekko japonicus]|uniref:Stimulated by retinoic acid gene 6 protein homolog isoform X2 n=1 Tax=Gekko japonicus TaxID=146911 RepID=A0ABM1LCM7_GEKJA|nr:PREDICTED: stimulated by retinoic acid gene 6 protein homolog isoform X2 [Gekko japonicus]